MLRNPEFAATLRAIAQEGPMRSIREPSRKHRRRSEQGPNHQGDITLADLAGYRVKEREPLCFAYRRNRICSMGPPSSGGLAVAQS